MEIVTNMAAFLQVKAWLEDGKDVRLGDWKAADIEILNTFQLLTAKPAVYLVSCLFMMIIIFLNCLICSLMVEWV
jgi:ribosome-binding ATPase YchF (GTP1/OBG family)